MGRNTGLLRTGKICVMCPGKNRRWFATCMGRGRETTVMEVWRLLSDCMI